MVASVGRISAGVGYDYLTKEVATSKHDYYTGRGEAAGVWTGRGIERLGLAGEVDADTMAHLYGRFVDPRTVGGDEQVLGQKVSTRVINAGTARERTLQPVAAFDVTFSPSKSVSALFAAATSEQVRTEVITAHEAAVAAGLEYLEDHASHGRAGKGGIRRVDSDGFVIAQFRHRTARATRPGEVGDPQLHSHCAILNRLHCADGRWRSLDGQAIYQHTHAAGAFYAAALERELTTRLGVEWAHTEPGVRIPMREIVGIPDTVRDQWSSRRQQVVATYERMLAKFRRDEQRSPTRDEVARMKNEATVRSRAPKRQGAVDLHERWRGDLDPTEVAAIDSTCGRIDPAVVSGGRLVAGSDQLARSVIATLEGERSWWTRAHLFAEVSRQIDTTTREAVEVEVERIATMCVQLEHDPDPEYARPDLAKMTSKRIIDAETFVMAEAERDADWTIPAVSDPILGDDQVAAVEALTTGTAQVATIIGPAGAGKTTLLESVAASYRRSGRDVRVLALAANAAQVVTEETGIPATTIATWQVGGADLPRNGLVLIDEASMVPTLTLRDLVRTAALYKTRVGLVGDYAQMGSPEAGGLLHDLSGLDSATLMSTVRRFQADWEGAASKRLRAHDPDVADTYHQHGRIQPTTSDEAAEHVAAAWHHDHSAGLHTLVVVDTTDTAADISALCQRHRLDAGELGDEIATGADSNPIRIGDTIQTRRNTTDADTSDGRRVLNRDVWTVTGTNTNGDVCAAHTRTNRTVVLPADYVTESVVLAYASTLAGSQGRTVDTGHVLVTPATNPQSLYVGMTRGRQCNTAHVVTNGHDHDEFDLGHRTPLAAFAEAIQRGGAGEMSATRVQRRWNALEPERQRDRSHDREHRYATQVWINTKRALHPATQARIAVTDDAVAARLTALPTGQWSAVLQRAINLTNWNKPNPTETFLHHLGHTDPAPDSPPPPPGHEHGRGPER